MLGLKRQDLEELYQLLELYQRSYESSSAGEVLAEVAGRYSSSYGENISGKRNPRKAGRRKQYTEKDITRVRELREKGGSIREIARETGYSVGYVQGVLSEP